MSTSTSPLWHLQKQAKKVARHLKRRGALPNKPIIKFSVIMDDKVIFIDMARTAIIDASHEALEAMIVREMQGAKTS